MASPMISIDQIPVISTSPNGKAGVIPSVDLSATGAAAAVVDACRRVGFFRVTNHGVPAGLADALEASATAFFALPAQDKLGMFGYGSSGLNGDAGWLEHLLLSLSSSDSVAISTPRTALEEYMEAMRELGGRVLELVAEGLGVDDRAVLRRMVVVAGDEMLRVNHYPPCPPERELPGRYGMTGFGEHTDPQIISLLRANSTPGLQIKLAGGSWAPVHPDPESFFVIVLTNGRFRSVKHRVVAPEGTLSRLSIIYFGGPAPSQLIAPLPQVMREGERSLYREFMWADYKKAAYKTVLADHRLGPFELPAAAIHNTE